MTKVSKNIEANEPVAESGITYVGQLDAKTKAALEAEHGTLQVLRVEVSKTEVSVAYYKKADRNVKAKALSFYMEKDMVKAGDLLLQNCYVAGDKRQLEVLDHEEISLAASVAMNGTMTFLSASLGE
jgi:hypothetical protein